ncbi:MAG: ABC transporter substrate-binding protein [Desulfobacterales bacterium]|nr:ABC transporter substrate-binding protein [Desulfobacterales bacterium]
MGKMQTGQDTKYPGFLLKILKRSSRVLVCIFLIGSILSCEEAGTPSAVEKSRSENVLRYDVPAPFTSLNPAELQDSGSNHIFPLLYSFLFVPNSMGKLEPDLALKWTYDAENHAWTIHLRKDALFHNKQPVTSKDVIYTFEQLLKNIRPALAPSIKLISPLSDTIVCIYLKKDDPYFPEKIWDIEIVCHPDKGKIDYFNHPIGSGPFKFKSRKGDNEVVLEANEDYYHGRPSLDGIVFHFQQDKEKAWTRLLSGETDIIQEISPRNYEIMQQYEKLFYFDLYTLPWYTILLYNTIDPLFSDPNVRLALSHCIDRNYIVTNILKGLGKVAVGPMGVESPYRNPDLKPVAYDPQKALMLLKKAGWYYDQEGRYLEKQDKKFEFTMLLFEESQIEKKVAQYIKLCLNDIGIRVHLKLLPYEELMRRYSKNIEFQAVLTEFRVMSRSPERLRELWSHHGSKQAIAGCFDNPDVTCLLVKVLDEKDPLRRKEIFYKIDLLITSLHPGTFLFHKTAIDVMSKRFKLKSPFSLSHEGIYSLRYASLNEKQLLTGR